MEYAIYILFAVTAFLLFLGILYTATQSTRTVRQRLVQVRIIDEKEDDEMKQPFMDRALYPIYVTIQHFFERLTPKQIKESYRKTILQAGLSEKMTPIRLVVFQTLLSLFTVSLLLMVRGMGIPLDPLIILVLGLIAFLFPYAHYQSLAKVRGNKIRKQLPDFLDMLYISVESGLAFDSAMKQTAAKMQGPLSEEVCRAMDDIAKGRDRETALRNIGQRSQVEEVSSFITAVIQSELLGSNIANMLKIQSRVMRDKRRQGAEEEAQKMPLKMLFPMVFLMFPALFVVILGPAIMNIIQTLGGFSF